MADSAGVWTDFFTAAGSTAAVAAAAGGAYASVRYGRRATVQVSAGAVQRSGVTVVVVRVSVRAAGFFRLKIHEDRPSTVRVTEVWALRDGLADGLYWETGGLFEERFVEPGETNAVDHGGHAGRGAGGWAGRLARGRVRDCGTAGWAGVELGRPGVRAVAATRAALRRTIEHSPNHPTGSLLATAVNTTTVMAVMLGIISVALWLFVARGCWRGSEPARSTGTVLFGLDTLGLLIGPVGLRAPGSLVPRILEGVVWLIGAGTVVLLWQKDPEGAGLPVTRAGGRSRSRSSTRGHSRSGGLM